VGLLYNPDGTLAENVQDEAVPDLVLGGKAGFKKGDQASVVSPEGEHFLVPVEQAGEAFRKGYRFESDQTRAKRKEEAKYSTWGQLAKTAVEGALAGPTLGASDLLEAGLLGNAKDIEARARVNRGTHGVAELGGSIAAMLLGDEAAPLGLLGKAGAGVEAGVEGVAGAGVLARGAGAVARGAVEGAGFGAAQEFRDEVLKGEPLDAQKLLSAAGTDALYGGGTSGVFHVLGAVARGGLDMPRRLFAGSAPGAVAPGTLDSVKGMLESKVEADPSSILGKLRAVFVGKDKLASMGRLAGSPEARDLAFRAESDVDRQLIDLAAGLDGHVEDFARAQKDVRSVIKRPEILRSVASVDPVRAREEAFERVNEMRAEVARMRAAPHEFNNSPKIDQLERNVEYLDRVLGVEHVPTSVSAVGGVPVVTHTPVLDPKKAPAALDIFDAFDKVRSILDNVAKLGEMVPATERPAANVASKIRFGSFKAFLEDGAIWGGAASAQQKYNRLAAEMIGAEGHFLEEFASKVKGEAEGGRAVYQVDPRKLRAMMGEVGTPENELRRGAMVNYLGKSKEVADVLASDPLLQQRLGSSVKATDDVVRLGRARADLRRLSENSGSALSILGSPLGRAFVGHALGGPLGLIAGAAVSPRAVPAVLHLLDQIANSRAAAIGGMARAFATGSVTGIAARQSLVGALNGIRFSDTSMGGISRTLADATAQRAAEIRTLALDPERRMALARAAVGPISPEHEKLAAQSIAQGERAFAYLQAHTPPAPPEDPLDPRKIPAALPLAEQIDFAERVRVVARPFSALEDLSRGTLTQVGAEALRTTAPELHRVMVDAVLREVRDSAKPLSYNQRLQLSTFIGAALDASTEPQAVFVMQSVYAQSGGAAPGGSEENGGRPPPLRSTQDIKAIRGAASAMDSLEYRRQGSFST
jgi:hypothetical protein